MGSHDGAEICELVNLFILSKLAEDLGNKNVELYRDDGLALIKAQTEGMRTTQGKIYTALSSKSA